MTHRVYNFNAGPATLPLPVLEEIQAELLDLNEGKARIRANGRVFEVPVEQLSQEDRDWLAEWDAVRNAHTPVWSETISPQMTFAPGSPGVYRRIFP